MNIAKYCQFCHNPSEYEHFHMEKEWYSEYHLYIDTDDSEHKAEFYDERDIRVSDGSFADENKTCLPCQAMRGFKNV